MAATTERLVRAWFGSHPIAEAHTGTTEAAHVAALMATRFAGLRITNEPDNQPIAKEATTR